MLRGQARGERRGVMVMHRGLGHQGRPDRRARDRFGGTASLPNVMVRRHRKPVRASPVRRHERSTHHTREASERLRKRVHTISIGASTLR